MHTARPLRVPTALFGIGLLTGCFSIGPDCISEFRNLTREGTLQTGERAFLVLDEERNAGSNRVTLRRITWSVDGNLGEDGATLVHIHQGPVGSEGPILATLPLTGVQGGRIITQGDVIEPGFLAKPFDEFFEIVRTQPVYVEVHSTQFPQGRWRIPTTLKFDNPWFHPYCS